MRPQRVPNVSRERPCGDGQRSARNRRNGDVRRLPAAPPGNGRALQHGGYSVLDPARVDAKVLDVADALAADAPLRRNDGELPATDRYVVRLLAQCLCRLDDVGAHLRDFGYFDQKTKEPRPALALEAKLRREAADYLRELGMTPRARVALGLDVARTMQTGVDPATLLSAAQSEPDPALRARLLERAGLLDAEDADGPND